MSGTGARGATSPSRALVVAAFAAVYGIWGSTYLAIAVAVETMPPLLMVSVRCVLAGGILLGWARLRGEPWPGRGAWLAAARLAVFLFGAYGLVALAERTVPSGVAALLGATSPLFVVLLDPRLRRRAGALAAVVLGLGGVALVATPWHSGGVNPAGALAVLGAAALWGIGARKSRLSPVPALALMATSLELLSGAALLLPVGLALGEWRGVDAAAVSVPSLLALGYLVVFGSIVAYTAFHWLLQVTSPALVSTHAYVNPVVALLLGWLLHAEPIGIGTLAAAGVILAAVIALRHVIVDRPVSRPREPAAARRRAA